MCRSAPPVPQNPHALSGSWGERPAHCRRRRRTEEKARGRPARTAETTFCTALPKPATTTNTPDPFEDYEFLPEPVSPTPLFDGEDYVAPIWDDNEPVPESLDQPPMPPVEAVEPEPVAEPRRNWLEPRVQTR